MPVAATEWNCAAVQWYKLVAIVVAAKTNNRMDQKPQPTPQGALVAVVVLATGAPLQLAPMVSFFFPFTHSTTTTM